MALSETTRAEMYNYFSATPLGKEVTSEMIANFPDLSYDQLVTKDFLRAELEATSRESAELGFSLRKEIADQGASLRKEIADQGASLRKEIADQGASLRKEMSDLRFELAEYTHATVQKSMLWTIGTMITLAGVCSTLVITIH